MDELTKQLRLLAAVAMKVAEMIDKKETRSADVLLFPVPNTSGVEAEHELESLKDPVEE